MADVPVLVCTEGSMKGRVIPVPDGGLTVGRADDNDIVINADGVSRYHARLLYEGGSLWLQDAGSRNGVFVNGNRVTDHRALRAEDIVTVADHTFAVRWQDELTEIPADDETEEADAPTNGARKPWYWPF